MVFYARLHRVKKEMPDWCALVQSLDDTDAVAQRLADVWATVLFRDAVDHYFRPAVQSLARRVIAQDVAANRTAVRQALHVLIDAMSRWAPPHVLSFACLRPPRMFVTWLELQRALLQSQSGANDNGNVARLVAVTDQLLRALGALVEQFGVTLLEPIEWLDDELRACNVQVDTNGGAPSWRFIAQVSAADPSDGFERFFQSPLRNTWQRELQTALRARAEPAEFKLSIDGVARAIACSGALKRARYAAEQTLDAAPLTPSDALQLACQGRPLVKQLMRRLHRDVATAKPFDWGVAFSMGCQHGLFRTADEFFASCRLTREQVPADVRRALQRLPCTCVAKNAPPLDRVEVTVAETLASALNVGSLGWLVLLDNAQQLLQPALGANALTPSAHVHVVFAIAVLAQCATTSSEKQSDIFKRAWTQLRSANVLLTALECSVERERRHLYQLQCARADIFDVASSSVAATELAGAGRDELSWLRALHASLSPADLGVLKQKQARAHEFDSPRVQTAMRLVHNAEQGVEHRLRALQMLQSMVRHDDDADAAFDVLTALSAEPGGADLRPVPRDDAALAAWRRARALRTDVQRPAPAAPTASGAKQSADEREPMVLQHKINIAVPVTSAHVSSANQFPKASPKPNWHAQIQQAIDQQRVARHLLNGQARDLAAQLKRRERALRKALDGALALERQHQMSARQLAAAHETAQAQQQAQAQRVREAERLLQAEQRHVQELRDAIAAEQARLAAAAAQNSDDMNNARAQPASQLDELLAELAEAERDVANQKKQVDTAAAAAAAAHEPRATLADQKTARRQQEREAATAVAEAQRALQQQVTDWLRERDQLERALANERRSVALALADLRSGDDSHAAAQWIAALQTRMQTLSIALERWRRMRCGVVTHQPQ